MNPIEKVLVKEAEKRVDESTKFVSELKLLLADNAAEERNILKAIGLDRDIRVIESRKEDVLTRAKHSEHMGKVVVHRREIVAICDKYRLNMQHASHFLGVIPADLPSELLRLTRENRLAIAAHADYNNFYVIAPPKMFDSYMTFGQIWTDENGKVVEEREERERLARERDPILVYKLDNDYYAIIRSWGHDFSALRRLYAILTTRTSLELLNFAHKIFLLVAFFGISYKAWMWVHLHTFSQEWIEVCTILGGGALNIVAAVFLGIWFWDEDKMKTRARVLNRMSQRIFGRR